MSTVEHSRRDLAVGFAQPSAPVSINAVAGRGWRTRHAASAPWRDAVAAVVRPWVITHSPGIRLELPVEIHVTLEVLGSRRRDPHNYVSTIMKPMVDGLVVAGLLPDDDAAHVHTHEPRLVSIKRDQLPGLATVLVEGVLLQ